MFKVLKHNVIQYAIISLLQTAHRIGGCHTSFYTVTDACLPMVGWLVDLAVGIKCTGVAISYLIVIGV